MKSILPILIIACLSLNSCKKSGDRDCGDPVTPNAVCEETVPKGEVCQAYFTRWFYDKSTKTCTQVGYSGCSAKGFATRQECETCK